MTFVPADPQTAPRYSWAEVWTAVLTRPSMSTFQEILNDPGMSRRRAHTWVIAVALISFVFLAASLLTMSPTDLAAQLPPDVTISTSQLRSGMILNLICLLPLTIFMVLGAFRFMVWLVQFAAKAVGGHVKSDSGVKIAYSFAAIQAPLNILSLLFLVVPSVGVVQIISLAASLYQLVLMSLAVRTVYELGVGRAAMAVLGMFAVIFAIVALIFVLGSGV